MHGYTDGSMRRVVVQGGLRQDLNGFVELLKGLQIDARGLGVCVEIEGTAVRETDALDPAVGALNLRVPAVLRVVRHLMRQVLPEAQPLHVDTGLLQKQEGAPDEEPAGQSCSETQCFGWHSVYIRAR